MVLEVYIKKSTFKSIAIITLTDPENGEFLNSVLLPLIF